MLRDDHLERTKNVRLLHFFGYCVRQQFAPVQTVMCMSGIRLWRPDSGVELSPFYVATEVRAHHAGMVMVEAVAAWEQYDAMQASTWSQAVKDERLCSWRRRAAMYRRRAC